MLRLCFGYSGLVVELLRAHVLGFHQAGWLEGGGVVRGLLGLDRLDM